MLEAFSYVPLLRTKPAEITAFHTLSAAEKASLFPVFLAKPWQNASHFQKTLDKVKGAVGAQSFGLGLDREHLGGTGKQPGQGEFDSLFNPSHGFRAYFECVESLDGAVPVFIGGGTAASILMQLGNADSLGRGLIVRFTRGEITPVLNLAAAVPPLPQDTVFIVDAGWGRDPLQLELWAATTVQRILDVISHAEIVVMCSSFPDSFGSIVGHGVVDLYEPQIYRSIRSRFNEARLVYGDWATTRPPQSGGGGTIPPRIDIPMIGSCNIFRADSEEMQSYVEVASEVVSHACFSSVPDCYGRSLIENTLSESGITGTQRATEARINIHLAKHATPQGANGEEQYVD